MPHLHSAYYCGSERESKQVNGSFILSLPLRLAVKLSFFSAEVKGKRSASI